MDSLIKYELFNNRIVYFYQITICSLIIITCLICICTGIEIDNEKKNFFAGLLCSIIGYILPNPKLKSIKRENKCNSCHNIDDTDNDNTSVNSNIWTIFGYKFPKSEIVYFSQIIICYIIIIVCLFCLVIGKPSTNDYLYTILTTTSLGYLLPNPKLKKKYGLYRNNPE